MNNKKTITLIAIFTIMITLAGGTFAYWMWITDVNQHTGVAFTIDKQFSCRADGGQDLTSANIKLEPTSDCTNPEYALQRTIKVTPEIKGNGLSINLDMWLKVNDIDPELAASDNLMYAISTAEGSCKPGMEGHVTSGNFKGLTTNDQATLLKNKTYSATTTDTYYLYIWLDAAETNSNTMDKSFDLSLGGICTDTPAPEAPVLDDGMIPVTIANDGTVTIVSEDDSSWYNYDEKKWANVVLVEENATSGVTNSHPRSYYQNADNIGEEVTQEDILAYYVWIPRYKYRIFTKCGNIENPTQEDYPECYGAPYTLNITEGEFFDRVVERTLNFIGDCDPTGNSDAYGGACTDEHYDAAEKEAEGYVEELLSTGYAAYVSSDNYGFSIEEVLDESEYNRTFYSDNDLEYNIQSIDILFETKTQEMKLGNATTEYRTHPSFWWDDNNDGNVNSNEMIAGIWVGKFATTQDKSNDCWDSVDTEDSCDNSIYNPTILPYASVLDLDRSTPLLNRQTIKNQFYTSRNISKEENIYGINNTTTNAHMMKNRDWGAILYLSHSKYGINDMISTDSTANYGKLESYPQSTTGNISGIFDMSIPQYVMAHYGNTINKGDHSGFGELPELKYYDLYTKTDCTLETCGGHALNETAGWYGGSAVFVDSGNQWLVRASEDGFSDNRSNTFSFYGRDGYAGGGGNAEYSWHSVLVPGFGD